MKPIILPNGIELASLDAMQGRVRMLSPLASADIRPDEKLVERLKDAGVASQWSIQNKNDNFAFADINDVLPQDGDYIQVDFRALSKVVVRGHWLDWTKDNVLKDSLNLLPGATVYANHNFYDINGWLGSVANAAWDEKGESSDGIPGINVRYKIDALMNPRIARGLMMEPPAIHSTSMTVLFEFEYSHPDMAAEDRWKFFRNLGEEIDGEIVRLIVTKVIEYWEASLVFQGADRLAKMQPKEVGSGQLAVGSEEDEPAALEPPNSNEEKTMKLNNEQKKSLGIEFDGDEVPETEIFKAAESLADRLAAVDTVNIAELTARATAGDLLVEEKRTEVVRLAKLAELGADDKELPAVIAEDIKAANVARLQQLGDHYKKKAAEKFPETGRSSQENSAAVDNAGGVSPNILTVPKVGLL